MNKKTSPNQPFEEFSNFEGSFLNPIDLNEHTFATPNFHSLNDEEQPRALLLASELDVSRYESVLQFGQGIQQELKSFTHNMLVQVQRNDTSPIREILHKLVEHLDKINPDDLIEKETNFFQKLFHRSKSSIQEMVSQYNRISKQIDRLSIQLQHSQKGLLADMRMLNDLYQLNEDYYHNLTIYIAAGEMKKKDLYNHQLPKLKQEFVDSSNPMDQQRLNDLKNSIEWLDKRLYDLQISREIAIQTAAQIRMIQETNRMLVDKIQSSVMTTIPLWQTQISMLVNMNNQRRANHASRRLMETSQQMIGKNAKMIEATANDVKKQNISHSEIDEFKQTQLKLIDSIEETLRVQAISNEQQALVESKIMDIDRK
ncbi:toxic anion resistance protein [Lysinibacillus yapensis]|uniref:Toxic anion resistance protein n=1 Tax=Ureibacillus yapensis TaxID=2304605 RepID=A0A396SFC4_9BACL|nr:toxic anion resistance protein [Lysinibacillus yapensis]RHW37558.1 toxic anion resistance protein [Lysinibacillus yapensis]